MPATVNIHEAKTHLSKLIEKAERGEETIIARAGKPAAKLVPIRPVKPAKRKLGFLAGQGFKVPGDFNEWGRKEIEEMFYGKPRGYLELPVSGEHALAVERLPPLHRDPFDRMLLCQAMVEGLTIVTNDEILSQYPVAIHWT